MLATSTLEKTKLRECRWSWDRAPLTRAAAWSSRLALHESLDGLACQTCGGCIGPERGGPLSLALPGEGPLSLPQSFLPPTPPCHTFQDGWAGGQGDAPPGGHCMTSSISNSSTNSENCINETILGRWTVEVYTQLVNVLQNTPRQEYLRILIKDECYTHLFF